jgi:hypothetical protein
MNQVLAVFLDGYEQALGQQMMAAGDLPAMAALARSSARYLLDHGPAQRTGLAGEHVATGLSPETSQHWSGVHFDPRSYAVWQEGTALRPFAADLPCRTVVFDPPYFDLMAAPNVIGVVDWGAHDPGIPESSRPAELSAELAAKFGPYPARRWIYGTPWPSAEATDAMGRELADAVDVRADAACWLLRERIPNWDLALVAASEPHSACEGLWHGIDPAHPLHHLPWAGVAGEGVRAVYRAIDRMVGKLVSTFPEAQVVVFTMGGMGPNQSDVPSMLLFPELMYRHAFGSPWFTQPPRWRACDGTSPVLLAETERWAHGVTDGFPEPALRGVARRLLPPSVKRLLHKALDHQHAAGPAEAPTRPLRTSLDWMPATAYRRFWRSMGAFALPSYYDGRIRVNLAGRESQGTVDPRQYRRTLQDAENAVRACVNPATGESVVDFVEYPALDDPFAVPPSQADLIVVWKGGPMAFVHPTLGRIGPVPYRRTGGHTGRYGMAFLHADRCVAGDRGVRNAFDVVPTLLDLMGQPRPPTMSGTSLLQN